ncbi:hypothetical protein EE36_00630 [Sulfitobacter sp. EE-36]|nr:hypothetical protein EE36_00630 [Sulfitobacter sp. EE-36]
MARFSDPSALIRIKDVKAHEVPATESAADK